MLVWRPNRKYIESSFNHRKEEKFENKVGLKIRNCKIFQKLPPELLILFVFYESNWNLVWLVNIGREYYTLRVSQGNKVTRIKETVNQSEKRAIMLNTNGYSTMKSCCHSHISWHQNGKTDMNSEQKQTNMGVWTLNNWKWNYKIDVCVCVNKGIKKAIWGRKEGRKKRNTHTHTATWVYKTKENVRQNIPMEYSCSFFIFFWYGHAQILQTSTFQFATKQITSKNRCFRRIKVWNGCLYVENLVYFKAINFYQKNLPNFIDVGTIRFGLCVFLILILFLFFWFTKNKVMKRPLFRSNTQFPQLTHLIKMKEN